MASAVPAEARHVLGLVTACARQIGHPRVPLIMVALLSTYSERAKVTIFSEVL